MKTLLATLTAALLAASASAQQNTIAEFSWQTLADTGQIKAGTVVALPDQTTALKIENPGPQPLMATVLVIEQPKITTDFYTVSGEVRYEGVEGDGFLEMWNHFGDGGAFFTRTMGESGPMGKLRGTSDWRGFILPFNAAGAKSRPARLVINVHLPAKGVVFLRSPLKLSESAQTPGSGARQPGAWWSDRTGNLVGSIAGTIFGCLGGLIGWFGSRGKARGFVLGTAKALIALGIVATVGGMLALVLHQPYAVWYPMLLPGVLGVVIFPFCLRRCEQRYREIELRRIASLDAA